MSFLIDPPLLVSTGAAIEASVPDEKTADRIEKAVLVIFLATSISLYLNLGWTRWIWRICGAESGRDWMLNSGVFHIDHRNAGPGTHLAAAATFFTYPLWMRLGRRLGGSLAIRSRLPNRLADS
ncbi:MAG: hypothetical protein ACYCTL_06710 [Acidimicrobiales bacterium]